MLRQAFGERFGVLEPLGLSLPPFDLPLIGTMFARNAQFLAAAIQHIAYLLHQRVFVGTYDPAMQIHGPVMAALRIAEFTLHVETTIRSRMGGPGPGEGLNFRKIRSIDFCQPQMPIPFIAATGGKCPVNYRQCCDWSQLVRGLR